MKSLDLTKRGLPQITQTRVVVEAKDAVTCPVLDTKGPEVTIKPESVGANGIYSQVSVKLHDTGKVDKVTINGVVKDLTDNDWSDVNDIVPGTYGAIEGKNTLVAYDTLGNTTTIDFVLDTKGPVVTIKPESVGANGIYSQVSVKLHDTGKVDKVTINGVVKDLTDNDWSDVNDIVPGTYGAIEGKNTLVAYDTLGNTTTIDFVLDTTRSVTLPTSFEGEGTYRVVVPFTKGVDTFIIGARGYDEHTPITKDSVVTKADAGQFWVGHKAQPGYVIANPAVGNNDRTLAQWHIDFTFANPTSATGDVSWKYGEVTGTTSVNTNVASGGSFDYTDSSGQTLHGVVEPGTLVKDGSKAISFTGTITESSVEWNIGRPFTVVVIDGGVDQIGVFVDRALDGILADVTVGNLTVI